MADDPKCTTPGACYRRHVAGCPRYVPLSKRAADELARQGWALEVGELTERERGDRRSPPMTLTILDPVTGYSHDHAFQRWSDPQDATPEPLDINKPQDHGAVGLAMMAQPPRQRYGRALRNPADKPPVAIIMDHDPNYPGHAEAMKRYTLKPKPALVLHVKLGKHTGLPYWCVLPRGVDIKDVGQWQTTDEAAMAKAKRCMALGVPVR